MHSPFSKTLIAINTATHRESVAVIESGKILAEKSWPSNRNESAELLVAVQKVLAKAKRTFNDVEGILIVTGPGPFSAIRIGVAGANALAYSLKKPVYAITTEALWLARVTHYRATHPTEKIFMILSAGKGHYAEIDFEAPHALNAAETISHHAAVTTDALIIQIKKKLRDKKNPVTLLCDMNADEVALLKKTAPKEWKLMSEEDKKQIISFAKALLSVSPQLIYQPKSTIVAPRYLRPPTITEAKKTIYAAQP